MTLHDLGFLEPGRPWPPAPEVDRITEYKTNLSILEGDHLKVFEKIQTFLDAEPTDKKLPVFVDTAETSAKTSVDLVIKRPPKIFVAGGETAKAEACYRLINTSKLARVIAKVAEDMTPCGVGVFKVRARDSRPIIQAVPPEHWFPVSPRGDPQAITAHVIAWTLEEAGEVEGQPLKYLFSEIYSLNDAGLCVVEHRLNSLKSEGGDTIGDRLELATFPEFSALPDVTETGVEGFLVVPVFNRPSSRHPYGRPALNKVTRQNLEDLEMLLSLQHNTLWQFNKPDVNAPQSAFTFDEYRKMHVFRSGEAHMVRKDEAPVSPVVWDIQSGAWEAMITRLLDQIYESLELSPQLVSNTREGGQAESGRALRFRLIPTLAKVDRIRAALDGGGYEDGIPLVLSLASQLEAHLPEPVEGAAPFEAWEVSVEWADSLPKDQDAVVERACKLKQNGLISTERYLEGEGLSEEARAEELERIKGEAEAAAGSLL